MKRTVSRYASVGIFAACLSLTGCATFTDGRKDVSDKRIPEGLWVAHSKKFPDQRLVHEVRTRNFSRFDRAGERRSQQRLSRLPPGWVTREFTLRHAGGRSTVYEATYALDEDVYRRLPKARNDPYAKLALLHEAGRLKVVESDDRFAGVYAGNYLEPLNESPFFKAIRTNAIRSLTGMPDWKRRALKERDALGRTALYNAALRGHKRLVERFLDAGVPVDTENARGNRRTALAAAIDQSHLGIVRRLLSSGADPNRRDSAGATALHVAAQSCGKYREVVRILLQNGADPHLPDKRGETPLEHVARVSESTFLPILEEEIRKHATQPR